MCHTIILFSCWQGHYHPTDPDFATACTRQRPMRQRHCHMRTYVSYNATHLTCCTGELLSSVEKRHFYYCFICHLTIAGDSTNTLLNFTMPTLLIHTYTPCVDCSPYQANVFSNIVKLLIMISLLILNAYCSNATSHFNMSLTIPRSRKEPFLRMQKLLLEAFVCLRLDVALTFRAKLEITAHGGAAHKKGKLGIVIYGDVAQLVKLPGRRQTGNAREEFVRQINVSAPWGSLPSERDNSRKAMSART